MNHTQNSHKEIKLRRLAYKIRCCLKYYKSEDEVVELIKSYGKHRKILNEEINKFLDCLQSFDFFDVGKQGEILAIKKRLQESQFILQSCVNRQYEYDLFRRFLPFLYKNTVYQDLEILKLSLGCVVDILKDVEEKINDLGSDDFIEKYLKLVSDIKHHFNQFAKNVENLKKIKFIKKPNSIQETQLTKLYSAINLITQSSDLPNLSDQFINDLQIAVNTITLYYDNFGKNHAISDDYLNHVKRKYVLEAEHADLYIKRTWTHVWLILLVPVAFLLGVLALSMGLAIVLPVIVPFTAAFFLQSFWVYSEKSVVTKMLLTMASVCLGIVAMPVVSPIVLSAIAVIATLWCIEDFLTKPVRDKTADFIADFFLGGLWLHSEKSVVAKILLTVAVACLNIVAMPVVLPMALPVVATIATIKCMDTFLLKPVRDKDARLIKKIQAVSKSLHAIVSALPNADTMVEDNKINSLVEISVGTNEVNGIESVSRFSLFNQLARKVNHGAEAVLAEFVPRPAAF